jgi:hypothetical protein
MKMPKVALNKAALLTFLLRHGEKIVAAMIGLVACSLVWGGIGAIRTLRPAAKQEPQAIVADAAAAADHIEAVKNPPAEEMPPQNGLAEAVAKWRETKVASEPPHALFSRPLFGEMARRTSPDILPVEDLRAVSGAAVLAVKVAPGSRLAPQVRSPDLDDGTTAKPPRPGARGGRRPSPQSEQQDPEMTPFQPEQLGPQGKVVPYVLVTGLIPLLKQQQEYHQRFDAASFRDANIDTPKWGSYIIERAEVQPGTAETWTAIDIKAAARRYGAEWMGFQSEPALPLLLLPSTQESRDPATTPIPFSSPMPQLADGAWGFTSLHPWFVDYLQRDAAEKQSKALADQVRAETSTNIFGGVNDNALDGGGMPPGIGVPSMPFDPDADTGTGIAGPVMLGPEYRLFRFIDLDVKPGHTYRYRVKVVCWNPNLNVPSRHLVDASLGTKPILESPESTPTSPVRVSDGARLLVRPLAKQELKKMKPGMVGVQILGEKPNAGLLALRVLIMEPGGLANVDSQQNRRGEVRSLGEAITTDRLLLDVRGRVEDRTETRAGKPTPPPEPLEMIFLRPDGGFDVATSADSQLDIERYRSTLPSEQVNAAAGDRAGQQPSSDESPFGSPSPPRN